MFIFSVDLGTTNIKVALYDSSLKLISLCTHKVIYKREGNKVEFDAEKYFINILDTMKLCAADTDLRGRKVKIALTGQAESFVFIRSDGSTVSPAVSWLDMRSTEECREFKSLLGEDRGYCITGQPWITPTWTATKLRWFNKNHPEILKSAYKILLLKDFICFRFTGKILGDISISSFSYLLDISKKQYCPEILDLCGINADQLAELVSPCYDIDYILEDVRKLLPAAAGYSLNIGCLDHMAGMIGTGSYKKGIISESAGTVLSVSMLTDSWEYRPDRRIACLIGPEANSYVLFNCCDSGGVCMEWFKGKLSNNISYDQIEKMLKNVNIESAPFFLPFLTGINPPEYFSNAKGAFLALRLEHNIYDMAYAVMEGVACMLKSNLDYCSSTGCNYSKIISTGGGAKSAFWTQLKANICDKEICVPDETDAPCRGAAIIAAVSEGIFENYENAYFMSNIPVKTFTPSQEEVFIKRYNNYANYIKLLTPDFRNFEEV